MALQPQPRTEPAGRTGSACSDPAATVLPMLASATSSGKVKAFRVRAARSCLAPVKNHAVLKRSRLARPQLFYVSRQQLHLPHYQITCGPDRPSSPFTNQSLSLPGRFFLYKPLPAASQQLSSPAHRRSSAEEPAAGGRSLTGGRRRSAREKHGSLGGISSYPFPGATSDGMDAGDAMERGERTWLRPKVT